MMKRMMFVFANALSIFALGRDPAIDGSSEDTFEESIEEVSDSLSEEDQAYFEMYLWSMFMVKASEFGFDPDVEDPGQALYDYFDGMTASDVEQKALQWEDEGEIEWQDPEEWRQEMKEAGEGLQEAAEGLEDVAKDLEQDLEDL